MKILFVAIILVLLVAGFFLYQGVISGKKSAPELAAGELPICGAKPNCVCSTQNPSDSHYIDSIGINARSAEDIVKAIESIGGQVTTNDGALIKAIFVSGIFRFVDDVLVKIDGDQLQVRSSSRVGHSDFGANRKRVEQLRELLS